MNNFLQILTLLLGISSGLLAQQLPTFNMYGENAYLINPAMVGFSRTTALAANYNYKWTGMPESPATTSLSFRHYLGKKLNMAYGGYVVADSYGPSTITNIGGVYAYHIRLNNDELVSNPFNHQLSIGFSFAASQYRIDGDELIFDDPNDIMAISQPATTIVPDAGVGIFYYSNYFFIGCSAAQLIPMTATVEADGFAASVSKVPHFYMNAGYKKVLAKASRYRQKKEKLLITSAWLQYAPGGTFNARVNARYVYGNKLVTGLGFSTAGEIMADFYMFLGERLRIGYAFNLSASRIGMQLGTSHEAGVAFLFSGGGENWFFPNLNFDK